MLQKIIRKIKSIADKKVPLTVNVNKLSEHNSVADPGFPRGARQPWNAGMPT